MLGVRIAVGPVLLTTASLAALVAAPCAAAINAWSRIGPPGGAVVTALATAPGDPDRAYAGTGRGGVFSTADGGASWSEAGGGLRWEGVSDLEVDPASADRLLAFEKDPQRMRRSVDGGAHWSEIALPDIPGDPWMDVAFAPLEPGVAYLASWTRLLRSEDSGATWQIVALNLPEAMVVYQVVPHPTHGGEIWLVTTVAGVLRSTDGGVHFEPRNDGLGYTPYAFDLAFDPADPDRIYLWTDSALERSVDGGAQWHGVRDATYVSALEVDGSGAVWLVVDGELQRSTDGGVTWVSVPDASASRGILATPGRLWSRASRGLRASADGGSTWVARDQGLDAYWIDSLVALRGEATALRFTDRAAWPEETSLLESRDGGRSWQPVAIASGIVEILFAEGLTVDENDPGRMALFGTFSDGDPSHSPFGPLRSEDGGESWFLGSSNGLWSCLLPTSIVFDAVERDRLLLSGRPFTSGCGLQVPGSCFTFRSLDGGETWTCLFAPEGPVAGSLAGFAAAPGRPGALLAVGGGLQRSLDFGETWQVVAQPPAGDGFSFRTPIWADADHAWIQTNAGRLLRSSDGGAHWTTLDGPGPQIVQLAPDPLRPATLYVRTQAAVFATDDGGETWEELAAGLPPVDLSWLVVDPIEPDRLYLATFGAGLLEYERRTPRPCVANGEVHCLRDGRFGVRALWQDFQGYRGRAKTLALTDETGAFWFFDPANYELAVKQLDGRPLTDSFWTFFASLSNVEYRLLVTDAETGASHGYFNPAGRFASVGDVNSLPAEGAPAPVAASTAAGLGNEAALSTDCAPGPGTLCLRDGRFALEAAWADFQGGSGSGVAVPLSSDTGAFWFFDDANVELLVKVLDGTGTNGRYWVFFGALSNVEFELTVRDLWTGAAKVYRNPPGRYASVGDVDAFLP